MNPTGGNLAGLAATPLDGLLLLKGIGSDLDAGVESIVTLKFILEYKVSVVLLRAEE